MFSSRIPDIHEINEALWYNPEETGFKDLGGWFASYRVEDSRDLHDIDVAPEWSIVTLRELVKLRINDLETSLTKNDINLRGLWDVKALKEEIRKKSVEITAHLWPVWSKRFNTRTATVKHWEEVLVIDVNETAFKDENSIDYSRIVDGGAQFKNPEKIGNTYARVPLSVYMAAKGGNRSILELYKHSVVSWLIPDESERNTYLAALGILDLRSNFELWSQSIWVPGWLEDGAGRFYALGSKADAFYPPNFTTKYMELLLQEKH